MCDSVVDARSGLRRRRKLGKKAETFLPDDVVIDILSWLPAKDVLRTRCVCKRWRELTSTKDFIDLHIRRSFCMIRKDCYGIGEAILDRCWEPARTRAKIHKVYEPNHNGITFSQNGLIGVNVINSNLQVESFLIFNPIYRDVVRIKFPINLCRPCFYGVFFHPVMKEYCALFRVTLFHKPLRIQYKILNLESDPKCRDIRNPSTLNPIIVGTRVVLLDKYLYWMVEPSVDYISGNYTLNRDIMEYDIEKEEFRVIPCPVPVNLIHYIYNVNLLNIDGVVSLVEIFPSRESVKINIWTLKYNEEQLWTNSSNYIISPDVYPYIVGVPKAIALRNGELVLQSNRRLYVCNLKQGTFKKFGRIYGPSTSFSSHVMSLVSLKNCRPNICLEEEDENNKGLGQKSQALQ